MEFKKRYSQLNAAQKKAVDTIDGPVMVIAGPGTGKTELLSVRTANILSKTDASPENILCLTFTDSGATAMRERLIGIIGKDAYKVAIHTFHSFGTEIINQNREYFYNGALFEPADDLSRYEMLRGIFDGLDYKNPLASTMNGEYTHQADATRVISELKRSGLTNEELLSVLEASEEAIDASERLIAPIISGTVNAGMGTKLASILPKLKALASDAETLYEITPLIRTIADGLALTLEQIETVHPTKPITAWKKKWFAKNDKDEYVFKSRAHLIKLRALAFIYYEYLTKMEQAGLYDYDDMILQVVHAMEVHDDLRYNLQEKYLYVMVDEFQDTNLAQMRILHNLTSNPVNEERPNILVVGDDDQAIYSFQGADISNILRFRELYPATELVTLTDNYRSISDVIDSARSVITQGENRLENIVEELDKKLSAHQTGKGGVELFQTSSIADERHWLVERIAEDIKKGAKPADIAVLARRHSEIQSLIPYFSRAGLTVQYERQDDVLEQPPIVALELLAKVVVTLGVGQHDQANALMPELLSHPAWGIDPSELWRLSLDAYNGRQLWLDVMAADPRFLPIHSWLIELAALSMHTPLEAMLDRMIGKPDAADGVITQSPFYDYFFSSEALASHPSKYLDYLAALRTIRAQLREYHAKDGLTLQSFLDFTALHRRLNTSLLVARSTAEGMNAVHLMTTHKAKGLEFDTVYIFNATDNVWGEKARSASRNIGYPENLPLAPAGDSADERLRLFYVAMTRAKSRLIISYSESDDRDKSVLLASFLSDKKPTTVNSPTDTKILVESAELAWHEPLTQPSDSLNELLKPTLDGYKLSVTHLNAFLDVTRGGPRAFLLGNLLHFPSSKSPTASYGSAVHNTLQQAHVHLTATGELKPVEDVLRDFEVNLSKERLSKLDYATYLQKGSEQLQTYLAARYSTFTTSQKAELNFNGQEVFLDKAHLTGMIDVVDIDSKAKTIEVTDYKTGKSVKDGKAKTDYEKIKLHKYRQQLMFYKLLVENSRDYSNYNVHKGYLEFVEPTMSGEIENIEVVFEKEDLDRFRLLIAKIWESITTLNLPDTSQYEPSHKGMVAFEEDLLDSRA